MELKTRFLQLCNFEPLGENSPTKLLLNAHFQHSIFDRYGGLVILVGENNVGKSRVLEALKTFNDVDIKICNEKDYFKPYTLKDTILSLEEETSVDNKITDFSCVDLKIQFKENGEILKELIHYPFDIHLQELAVRFYSRMSISSNELERLRKSIISFVEYFKEFAKSQKQLKSFLIHYGKILGFSKLVVNGTQINGEWFFKELVKNLSGSESFIEKFCLCIDEIIECNTPNKKCERNKFYLLQEPKQNKLQEISVKLQKIFDNSKKHPNEIKKELKSIIKTLNIEVFGNNFDKIFESKVLELEDDYQKEKCEKLIDEIKQAIENQYPINKEFKKQFENFKKNKSTIIKEKNEWLNEYNRIKEDFNEAKEELISYIKQYLKEELSKSNNNSLLKIFTNFIKECVRFSIKQDSLKKDASENINLPHFSFDRLLNNIYQICSKYISSHEDKDSDMNYKMCKIYLNKIDLLLNNEKIYKNDENSKIEKQLLWEAIKKLDNRNSNPLFPKNFKEMQEKFEKETKEKIQKATSLVETIEYCRECNPYTDFSFERHKMDFDNYGSNYPYSFVSSIRTYIDQKVTNKDLKATFFINSDNYEFSMSPSWFFLNSLFRKIRLSPNDIWDILGLNLQNNSNNHQDLQIKFDDFNENFEICRGLSYQYDRKILLKIPKEYFKPTSNIKIEEKFFILKVVKSIWNEDGLSIELKLQNDSSFGFIEGSLKKILEYNIQSRIDSLAIQVFNKLCAISQDEKTLDGSYRFEIGVQYQQDLKYDFEFKIYDHRKSKEQKPVILDQQSMGFKWVFNFVFGFLCYDVDELYNSKNNVSYNIFYNNSFAKELSKNNIYVIDEPATNLSVPARKQFREFLKDYAYRHGVTFVLATHDPFLVDTDHLDEIRIVEKQENDSVIHNDFNYPLNDASKDSDALDKIKRSLGVGQHVFHNPMEHQIIFVEGITDYCYLTAFKLYFNEHYPQYKDNPINFTFLPISGLKDNAQDMETTIKALQKLDRNPVVLIDDDRKSGVDPQKVNSEKFKEKNKDLGSPIKILQLSQCNENFKQIEDLFSASDKEKYAKNKRMELAMAFKTKLLNDSEQDVVSKQTESNFLKLFEWIIWATNLIKN